MGGAPVARESKGHPVVGETESDPDEVKLIFTGWLINNMQGGTIYNSGSDFVRKYPEWVEEEDKRQGVDVVQIACYDI